jgi:hypothetical protein
MIGTTYCFYSYKGGVGRSMALANLAILFFRRPLDVIVVDWDLEAPGIERYFADRYPSANSELIATRPGLCDLLQTYRSRLTEPPEPGERATSPYPNLDDYLVTIESNYGCALRILPSGDRSDWTTYANFVQAFDWADFYANWGGGGFFEWLREELVRRADLVLIDTRTGITELGGVATRQMADVIVVLFAGNEENMASSARMAASFMAVGDEERDGRPLAVMMVPSRIDDSDSSEFARFHNRLAELESLVPANPDCYRMRDTLLPYRARLAFREQLVIGDSELETVLGPLVEGYERLAANMQQSASPNSRLRHGTGVARGRIYLLARPHQIHVELQIRGVLQERDFEVLPSAAATDGDPDDKELASSICVLVLLDERMVQSRQVNKVLRHADKLNKPVIPVLIDPQVNLPLALSDVVPLKWSEPTSRAAQNLLRAVRNTIPTAGTDAVPFDSSAADAPPRLYLTYSQEDTEVARRIAHDFGKRGIDAWLDVERLAPGQEWRTQAQEVLDRCDGIVVLVSPALRQNRYAAQEISYTLSRGKRIVPLRVAPVAPSDISLELADLSMIDAVGPSYSDAIDAVVDVVQRDRRDRTN